MVSTIHIKISQNLSPGRGVGRFFFFFFFGGGCQMVFRRNGEGNQSSPTEYKGGTTDN